MSTRTLMCLAALLGLAACSKETPAPPLPAATTSKTVVFKLSTATDYTHPYFSQSFGRVQLTITRHQLSADQHITVFDTVFQQRPLASYHSVLPMEIRKEIKQVNDHTEMIRVVYFLQYETHMGGFTNPQFRGLASPVPAGNHSYVAEVVL